MSQAVLAGRYEVKRTVGEGSFSVVFEGFDREENRKVALKKLKVKGLTKEEAEEAQDLFFREIEVLKGLKHPGIPQYYDFLYEYDSFFLVMEWIEGQDLETLLEDKGPFPQYIALRIMTQTVDVLDYFQKEDRSIVFKDLKPSNIMLTRDRNVKVIDFGTARRFSPDKEKDTMSLGTPGYAPPEAYKEQTDLSSDVYSFGATFYHLVTGEDPFQFKFNFPDPRKYNRKLTKEFSQLLLDCLKPRKIRMHDADALNIRVRALWFKEGEGHYMQESEKERFFWKKDDKSGRQTTVAATKKKNVGQSTATVTQSKDRRDSGAALIVFTLVLLAFSIIAAMSNDFGVIATAVIIFIAYLVYLSFLA